MFADAGVPLDPNWAAAIADAYRRAILSLATGQVPPLPPGVRRHTSNAHIFLLLAAIENGDLDLQATFPLQVTADPRVVFMHVGGRGDTQLQFRVTATRHADASTQGPYFAWTLGPITQIMMRGTWRNVTPSNALAWLSAYRPAPEIDPYSRALAVHLHAARPRDVVAVTNLQGDVYHWHVSATGTAQLDRVGGR